MKTAIICISDTYLERGRALERFYQSVGDEVLILTPDFSHRTKQAVRFDDPAIAALPHRPYRKNLSWARLKGHWDFSKTARRYLEIWKPGRIHCLLPANSLARQMDFYKKDHPDVQLIFDVNDLWPESLPAHGLQNTFLLAPWKQLRNAHLGAADLVLFECGLFEDRLSSLCTKSGLLYWSGPSLPPKMPRTPAGMEPLRIAYLGSMNHILDIGRIDALLEKLAQSRKLEVHLIGTGENASRFFGACQKHAHVIDHGAVYDDAAKEAIFDDCHFGLNVMKPEVQVGLSLKSLDYTRFGLPLLNSLGADSKKLVENEGIGIQIDRADLEKTTARILAATPAQIAAMKASARSVYEKNFAPEAFETRLGALLNQTGLLTKAERLALKTKGELDEHAS